MFVVDSYIGAVRVNPGDADALAAAERRQKTREDP
jgi:hypothetical protein